MTIEEPIYVSKRNYHSSCFEDLCEAVNIAIEAISDSNIVYLIVETSKKEEEDATN